MIDASHAWQIFLESASKYKDEVKAIRSPLRGHDYHVTHVDKSGVSVVSEMATTGRLRIIKEKLFKNSIKRVNQAEGKLQRTLMCPGSVLFEAIIVELLPILFVTFRI